MAKLIQGPTVIEAHGNAPKLIHEYFGRVNSGDSQISIAQMSSPAGWQEPGQTPEFHEYTLVLAGELQVETQSATHTVLAGQAILTQPGEWVRYSTPKGADYVAICTPAFSMETVHRDDE